MLRDIPTNEFEDGNNDQDDDDDDNDDHYKRLDDEIIISLFYCIQPFLWDLNTFLISFPVSSVVCSKHTMCELVYIELRGGRSGYVRTQRGA